jgi:hypothetical protein
MMRILVIISTLIFFLWSNLTLAIDEQFEKLEEIDCYGIPLITECQESAKTNITADNEKQNSPIWHSWIKLLNEYAPLLSALVAFFTGFLVFLALYFGVWRDIRRRPKLKLFFNEVKEFPYFHKVPFERYEPPIVLDGKEFKLLSENSGKSTAKKVQARVEKIELYREKIKIGSTKHYHPTTVKWSGEPDLRPVDIAPYHSFFFLDVFYAKNESLNGIYSFTNEQLGENNISLEEELLKEFIKNDIRPSGEIYWNVWIDTSYDRGVPKRYDFEGEIKIDFIINAENCDPVKFKAIINWTFKNWNQPDIKIMQGNKYINNDRGGESS